MRLLLLGLGTAWIGIVACAESQSVGGGDAGGFGASAGNAGDSGWFGGNGGAPTGGSGGAPGGSGGAPGGSGGTPGGSGGTPGGSGGTGATGAGGGTGGIGATGGTGGTGAVGASGGTGGTSSCTPPVTGGKCDTFPQCGCGSGLACNVVDVTGVTQCVAAGKVNPYNACALLTDCVAGYACVGDACKAFCEKDTDCTSTGGKCIQVQYDDAGVPKPVPGMKVCTKKCQLQNPAADCGPTLGCYVDTSTSPSQTDCAGAGTATGAGACSATTTTVCAPGWVCLTSGDCRKWCRVGFTTDCPSGKTCQAFAAPNQIFVDAIEYGVCTL